MYIKAILITILGALLPIINYIIYTMLKTRMSYLFMVDSINDLCMAIGFVMPIFINNLSEESKFIIYSIITTMQMAFVINNTRFSIINMFNDDIEDLQHVPKRTILIGLKISLLISIITICIGYTIDGYHPIIFLTHICIDTLCKGQLIYFLCKSSDNEQQAQVNVMHAKIDKMLSILYALIGVFSITYEIIIPSIQNMLNFITTSSNTSFINGVISMILLTFFIIISYISCAMPLSYMIIRMIFNIDLQEVGSGNPGTTNVSRALKSHGYNTIITIFTTISCGIADMARGFIPIFLIQRSDIINIIYKHLLANAGLIQNTLSQFNLDFVLTILKLTPFCMYTLVICAGMIGNMWSPFLNFHGGLGAACMFGMISGLASSNLNTFLISLLGPISWFILNKIIHKFSNRFIIINKQNITINIGIKSPPLYTSVIVTTISSLISLAMIYITCRTHFYAALLAFILMFLRHYFRKGLVDTDELRKLSQSQ